MLAQGHVLAQHFFGSEIFLSLPAPKCVACWRSFPNTNKLENAMSQVSKRKKSAKKMRRRKLQKKGSSENATLEVAFFFAFSVLLLLAFAFSVAFLDFPDLLQLALWFCLEFSRQRMLLIEGGTATSLGARGHIAQELPGSLHVSLSFGQFQS